MHRKGVHIVEFDYSKLRGRITEKYGTISEMVTKNNLKKGLSRHGLSLRLNNNINFSQDEIIKLVSILDIDALDIHAFFFCLKSSV